MHMAQGKRPFSAKIVDRRFESKRVFLLRLDVSKARTNITAGDHIAVFPVNKAEDVKLLMNRVINLEEENFILRRLSK